MNRSRALLVLALVLAVAAGQLSGARPAAGAGGSFTDITAGLTGVSYGSVAWGDYDSDGDLDFLLTGSSSSSEQVSKIYKNNGAGTFSEDTTAEGVGLIGVNGSSVAWGDYDSDGDLDILLTGENNSLGRVSKIYKNNGAGNAFTEDVAAESSLTGVSSGSVAWGDYNSDGKPDILLTGSSSSGNISKIYKNNGNGTFSEDATADSALPGVYASSVAWGDYDSDGDLDILLTGYSSSLGQRVSKIYENNGAGNAFSEDTVAGSDLTGVFYGSVAWGDYDSDGDLDILLTGDHGNGDPRSQIYRNDDGVFTDIGAGLTPIYRGSVAWGDYDSDGDLDILLTGLDTITPRVSKIFKNNGGGSFTEDTTADSDLIGVEQGSVAWGDYDSDGDLDILLAGDNHYGLGRVSRVYENNTTTANGAPSRPAGLPASVGSGTATLSWNAVTDDKTPQKALTYNLRVGTTPGGSDVVSPLSLSDGTRLVAQNGNVGERTSHTLTLSAGTYYWSVQAVDSGFAGSAFSDEGTFTIVAFPEISAVLTGVDHGSVAWGDYDSDGDFDILLTGHDGTNPISKIYRNDDGAFSEIAAGLTGVRDSSVAWGDYDSDGDLDILLTGHDGTNPISKIYRNDAGAFTDIAAGLTGVYDGSVAWGDYDSDGDLDILLTGHDGTNPISKIYRNDDGVFTDIAAVLSGVEWGSVAWGDYDSDGDLDILLAGYTGTTRVAKIYRNDGSDGFTDIGAGLTGVSYGSVAWGDYDSDGDLDILLAGWDGTPRVTKIYRNDGSSGFTSIDAGLTRVYRGSVAWGDYDSDGDLDILLAGHDGATPQVAKIYRNDGGVFTEIAVGLTGVYDGSVAWGDYDSDGKLDILLAGNTGSGQVSSVYRNYTATASTPPTAPSTLSASFSAGIENLSWNPASDSQTPAIALTYNLRVGTTPGGSQIVSPHSLSSGTRLVSAPGNVGKKANYSLAALVPGTYYWSVQAVDSGFAGSPFAGERTFTVLPPTFAFSAADYSVGEGGGTAQITISRTGLTSGSDSVQFVTANGTATAGIDYTAVSQPVSFAAGETQKTVPVSITDDSQVESSETVLLSLSGLSSGATLGIPSAATLTIADNDVAPPPVTTTSKGKIASCKLSKKSFPSSQAGKVKLTCKFSPKSKIFRYVLSLKKGKKRAVVKSVKKSGSFKTYTITVKKLFAGKAVKRGSYRLKLSADKNSKLLSFRVT